MRFVKLSENSVIIKYFKNLYQVDSLLVDNVVKINICCNVKGKTTFADLLLRYQ